MDYDELDPFQPVQSFKATDITTPVFCKVAETLRNLLTVHGAVVEQRGEPWGVWGATEQAVTYHIHFPEGSLKQVGLLLGHTRYFTIQFPDGFTLQGHEEMCQPKRLVQLLLPGGPA